jgi:hypothetical protein
MSSLDEEMNVGVRLGDLRRDGGLSEVIDRETAALRRERDAYLEAAVERELQLRARDEAEAVVTAEADRRSSTRRLRAV